MHKCGLVDKKSLTLMPFRPHLDRAGNWSQQQFVNR